MCLSYFRSACYLRQQTQPRSELCLGCNLTLCLVLVLNIWCKNERWSNCIKLFWNRFRSKLVGRFIQFCCDFIPWHCLTLPHSVFLCKWFWRASAIFRPVNLIDWWYFLRSRSVRFLRFQSETIASTSANLRLSWRCWRVPVKLLFFDPDSGKSFRAVNSCSAVCLFDHS